MQLNVKRIEQALGTTPLRAEALHGGNIAEVLRLHLADGRRVVAKIAPDASARFDLEGRMLSTLRERSDLPVPDLLYAAPDLLILSEIPGNSRLDARAQADAAQHLAALHAHTSPTYGLEYDTLIGGLHQPNTPNRSWIAFFREQRLLYMAQQALDEGELPARLMTRIEALAARLERYLFEPAQPALIHGDMWTTNILAQDGRITGFLDPAIYYAHEEIELAFSTLFGTFSDAFFRRYAELRPIAPGFFEERRDLYNLYPLLVHVRLFGGSYVSSVESILRRLGV